MLTKVYSLQTGEVIAEYTLRPLEALVAAWEQHHKNFNTWEYAKKIEQDVYCLTPGKYGIELGNFWVMNEETIKMIEEEEKCLRSRNQKIIKHGG